MANDSNLIPGPPDQGRGDRWRARNRLERELVVVASSDIDISPDEVVPRPVIEAMGANRRSDLRVRPLFGLHPYRMKLRLTPSLDEPDGTAGLTHYFRVHALDEEMEELASRMSRSQAVHAAYVKPAPEPAGLFLPTVPLRDEAPSVTPDFTPRQGYLDPAPGGVDARYAWTVAGGAGAGVRIVDVEGAWQFTHEDLLANQGGIIGGTPGPDVDYRNHGTSVLGVFSADRNGFGVTGIGPDANVRAVSYQGGFGIAAAIRTAADALSAGDILLIELHYPGPRFGFQSSAGQRGFIPVEWLPDNQAAVRYATAKGILVVEAGGNGFENLDDPLYDRNPQTQPYGPFQASWRNPFRRNPVDSLAILVGAGAPPPGTHGRNWGPDRSRLDFSNFGQAMDVQAWGREVTTTGGGELQGGSDENLWYTDIFAGTSSASPIVAGVLSCAQGALRAAQRPLLTPATARDLLRNTGSAQQDAPGLPATGRIGNRPDLRQILQRLIGGAASNGS